MPRRKKKKKTNKNNKRKQSKVYSAGWNPDLELPISQEALYEIIAIFLALLGIFTLLSLLGVAAKLGNIWAHLLKISIGWTRLFLPIIFLSLSFILFYHRKYKIKLINLIGLFAFIISLSSLFHLSLIAPQDYYQAGLKGQGGGFLGYLLINSAYKLVGVVALFVFFVAILLVSILLIFNTSLKEIISILKKKFSSTKEGTIPSPVTQSFRKEKISFPETPDQKSVKERIWDRVKAKPVKEEKITTSTLKDEGWQLPPVNLLKESSLEAESGDIKRNIEIIQKTLAHFGIMVEMGEVNIGPTVTQYTLKPATGIKLSRITALANDLALALAAHPIRIEAPIPGRSLVGVEVPNKSPALVSLRGIIESPEFQKSSSNLTIAIGRDVAGKPIVDDLAKMPHLLIAGATGSGKTVCINSIITSLLYKNSPEKLKLILIDPKRVELTYYNEIPHLITPVVTDPIKTISALKWALAEMDRRYKIFEECGKQNIITYNKTFKDKKLPYIITIIDELADLMMISPQEVETAIVRLSQMARATGIHLIISTQRPSVNVITGLIKANITYRIAFATASQVDSRTILDMAGAEKLLGSGDMLYLAGNTAKPRRLQGAFISEEEIKRVSEFLRKQGKPEYNEEVTKMEVKGKDILGQTPEDELFEQAAEMVIKTGKASASFLQRRLKVGYARAARLIDLLEERGIVGPAEGSKPREILVESLEEVLEKENEDNFPEKEMDNQELENRLKDYDA